MYWRAHKTATLTSIQHTVPWYLGAQTKVQKGARTVADFYVHGYIDRIHHMYVFTMAILWFSEMETMTNKKQKKKRTSILG